MGKKSRVKIQKSGSAATTSVSSKEMMILVSELLAGPTAGKEWEEYLQIRGLVEKIRKKQRGMSVEFEGRRGRPLPTPDVLGSDHGASCEGFAVTNFGAEGYGLRAPEELFLWIPRKMLMTVGIGPLYNQDRILQRANPASFWLPYIRTLPQEYDTPLFYEQDEVQLLQGTQAVQDVLSQYRNTARQYTHPASSKLPLKDSFTFDDYRWAVSSVMTRQNQIPTEDGRQVTLALIPLWDMCNHRNGLITTGYNLEDDRCECVALQDYKKNEQIYIFLRHKIKCRICDPQRLLLQENAHDQVKIKLGISKSERLYAMKAEVLARAGIPIFPFFALYCNEQPISAQLLAFLRVFCMKEEELRDYLLGGHAINKIVTLGSMEFPVSWDNEIKLWTFLETRVALLLKAYKTTSEEDSSTLEKSELSPHSRMAIQLRLAEKWILEKALASGRAKRVHFQKQLEEGAPLPDYHESSIALLENTDAKLPIILHKLGEIQEGQEIQFEETGARVENPYTQPCEGLEVSSDTWGGGALKPQTEITISTLLNHCKDQVEVYESLFS
uniref:protein-histidine N-methyltransferase n=1 Tax=Takifugu rubripes TaxID=31033 RepID=A0A674P001_TAKRU